MNEKLIFWAVVVWMVGMLALGIIAVKEVWKDTLSSEGEEEPEGEKLTDAEKNNRSHDSRKGQTEKT